MLRTENRFVPTYFLGYLVSDFPATFPSVLIPKNLPGILATIKRRLELIKQ